MEESAIPSLSMGEVGSRFITSDEIETARARRDEQWKAAYARLGQEPPPQPQADVYDGRSLAEKLAANRAAKQEEWEEKSKLANQFRALEEDEIMFLDSIREREEAEEKARRERDGEEVKGFKEAVAARMQLSNAPPLMTSASTAKPTAPKKETIMKRDIKKPSLKGVVVKKKKPAALSKTDTAAVSKVDAPRALDPAKTVRTQDTDGNPGDERSTKRRKVSESTES